MLEQFSFALSLRPWGSSLGDGVEMTDRAEMPETLSFSPRHASREEAQPRSLEGQDVKETSKISD